MAGVSALCLGSRLVLRSVFGIVGFRSRGLEFKFVEGVLFN